MKLKERHQAEGAAERRRNLMFLLPEGKETKMETKLWTDGLRMLWEQRELITFSIESQNGFGWKGH